MSYKNSNNLSYDKYAEHQDRTSLGKLRSKYWTTKQLVIKKLGREEDEFVIASDADVDAKLELLYTIKRSCHDLLRIMEHYQKNVLFLSHEETDMARFLKDYAQMDNTRAGKMMASVSKVLAYTAQQRLTLRQPLLRLHNEIETFRHRAVTDTFATVKRMETARTEYRGSILWLKDASVQLDPDKQLEKFRRVQSQVKTTKTEYERLKSDVIQKIDLLTASRCNMYSHVLAAYQKGLLSFWAKTSKIMSAVAESFQGYQYYEFTVIKDLAEPSRLLAEMNSSSFMDKTKQDDKKEKTPTKTDDALIDIDESIDNSTKEQITSTNVMQKKESIDPIEPINALIDISDDQLDDQLLEIEKLTTIDQAATAAANTKTTPSTSISDDNIVDLLDSSIEQEKFFSDFLSPLSSETNNNNNNINSDLLGINESNSFDADWTAAFGNNNTLLNQQLFQTSTAQDNTGASKNNFLPSSLLSELLASTNKTNKSTVTSSTNSKPKPTTTTTGKPTDKSNWFNLFAELDPIQNPDAIGKIAGDEADRNC
ncbi:unnamed protein product [Rotaria sp. Silwood1]|nr:unnamed protein product [Rotaria sp. Silwood1]CAF3481594.1 unnamed protein product [Rotaria sp. Silwood1]CAF3502054.1 unnamed protein product [Rotaria sp. Silwood1]CAF3506664.1 unnamed protein product [Rotaria sp. Silwood1]CAF4567767.1 unnamed protein product [Rotaria sp. Silwood1]